MAMIRIGFHIVAAKSAKDPTTISIARGGRMVLEGEAHIGRGSKLAVAPGAELVLGDNFAISASSAIVCNHSIRFGRDIQFSWDCLVMDSDSHTILDEQQQCTNPDRPVTFGDKVWIGCRCTILKGTTIPSNCVIGAGSLVAGHHFEPGTLITGQPARSVRRIGGWRL